MKNLYEDCLDELTKKTLQEDGRTINFDDVDKLVIERSKILVFDMDRHGYCVPKPKRKEAEKTECGMCLKSFANLDRHVSKVHEGQQKFSPEKLKEIDETLSKTRTSANTKF